MKKRTIEVVVGQRGSGKTLQTKEQIEAYDGKVLIMDYNDEYTEYEEINPLKINSHIYGISKVARVVIPSRNPLFKSSQTQDFSIIYRQLLDFGAGLLVIENADAFRTKEHHFLESLTIHKTKTLDILLIYHSLERVTFKVMQNADFFRVHKCIGRMPNPRYKNRFPSYMNALLADIHFLLNTHEKDDRFKFYMIDSKANKILGISKLQINWLRIKYSILNFFSRIILAICEMKKSIKSKKLLARFTKHRATTQKKA